MKLIYENLDIDKQKFRFIHKAEILLFRNHF